MGEGQDAALGLRPHSPLFLLSQDGPGRMHLLEFQVQTSPGACSHPPPGSHTHTQIHMRAHADMSMTHTQSHTQHSHISPINTDLCTHRDNTHACMCTHTCKHYTHYPAGRRMGSKELRGQQGQGPGGPQDGVYNQARQLPVWGLALLEEWGAEAGRAGRGELGQPEGALGVKRN